MINALIPECNNVFENKISLFKSDSTILFKINNTIKDTIKLKKKFNNTLIPPF